MIWPWGSELQPTFSGGFCSFCFGGITSVAEVVSLLFLLLLRVLSTLAEPPWCVSSANLGTPEVSTRCLAAGCPSGVPLLATLFRWQTVREALLFLLYPDGCRRFIEVRGVGSFFRAFGFQEVGAVSFRTLSGGSLSLHWQAWRGRGAETRL